jgi:hypothetical protein
MYIKNKESMPCHAGVVHVVVIVTANGTDDRGFESQKGISF